jgi:transposase-like protein
MGRLDIPGADPRLRALVARLGAEAGSRRYLEELRWPGGVICPRCDSGRIGFVETRSKHQCKDCAYQFRCTAGTVFHDSHVSIPKWLLAVGLMVSSKDGFPAVRLQRKIGGSYKTAWFVEHRIRAAMANALVDQEVPVAQARAAKHHARGGAGEQPVETLPELAPERVRTGLELINRVAGGAYHVRSPHHLSAYWAETRWRARHFGDASVFHATVAALLAAEPVRYDQLTRRR